MREPTAKGLLQKRVYTQPENLSIDLVDQPQKIVYAQPKNMIGPKLKWFFSA